MKRSMALLALATACSGDLPLEGRPCPCAEGWTCCARTRACVRSAESCPNELTRLLGVPGGRGTADGVGKDARFNNPRAMTGDGEFLYVSDGPPAHDLGPSDTWLRFQSCCLASTEDCIERCAGELRWGVRRVTVATGEVEWLVTDRPIGALALDGADLYGSTAQPERRCAWGGCWPEMARATALIRIDTLTGDVEEIAGATVGADAPRDGAGADARFESIGGVTADGAGTLYVTDGQSLRSIELTTGTVTTLVAGANWLGAAPPSAIAEPSFRPHGALTAHGGTVFIIDAKTVPSDLHPYSQTVWKYDPAKAVLTQEQTHFGGHGASVASVRAICFGPQGAWGILGNCVAPVLKPTTAFCFYGSFADTSQPSGAAGSPGFSNPSAIWCAEDGSMVLTDTGNALIRKLPPPWALAEGVQTVAGDVPHRRLQGDYDVGPWMRLASPRGITTDRAGNAAFVSSDQARDRLFRIARDRTVSEYPDLGYISRPRLDSNGKDVYLLSNGISKLDYETGEVVSVVGGNHFDFVPDGSSTIYASDCEKREVYRADLEVAGAFETLLTGRCGFLALGEHEQLFIAALPDDASETWGGSGSELLRVDLQNMHVRSLPTPPDGWEATALAYDPAGVLYIAEKDRQRVRGLVVETGEVFDVVGKQGSQGVQLGPLPASLNTPYDIALLAGGGLAITDSAENVILVAK
jgi:hypothetical protein